VAGAYRWKGAVQFGPAIQFNVIAKSAVKPIEFRFNQHHAECGGRLAQSGMTCTACGETGIAKDQIVRGYGGVAGVDEEYIESLGQEANPLQVIESLVPLKDVDPRYFQKSYEVTPEKGSEAMYVLFLRTLESKGLVAVSTVVMGGRSFPTIFRPDNGVLAMEVLFWHEELVPSIEAVNAIADVKVSQRALQLGKQLADALTDEWHPEAKRNDYAEALQTYLDGFVNGAIPTPISKPKAKASRAAQSLEDALAASLAALPAKPKAAARKKAS
jgi:DNA end-binding protein Ku